MNIKELQETTDILKDKSESFFSSAKEVCGKKEDDLGWSLRTSGVNHYWDELPNTR